MSIAELLAEGRDVITIEEAAAVLGIGRGGAYAAARAGQIPVLQLGRRYLVPVRRLAALLGVDE